MHLAHTIENLQQPLVQEVHDAANIQHLYVYEYRSETTMEYDNFPNDTNTSNP